MKRLLLLKTRAILGGCIGLVFAMLAWSGGTGHAAGSGGGLPAAAAKATVCFR
jgi:hypothetical protein